MVCDGKIIHPWIYRPGSLVCSREAVKHMKKGKALEKLIESLERAMADKEYVIVESPKKLPDKRTGRLREHDVVLTVKQAHHQMFIAIECRDRSRPITVPQVEGFYQKCLDTSIDQGIIVSSSGFYRTAREKAEILGIRCLDLEKATSLEWLLAPGLTIFSKTIKHTNWTLIPGEDISETPSEFSILNEEGIEITKDILAANLLRKLDRLNVNLPTIGSFRETFSFRGEGLFVADKSKGLRIPLKQLIAIVDYEVTSELQPFELIKYSEKGKGHIADAAIATMRAGDVHGKFILVYKESEGGHLVFVPEK